MGAANYIFANTGQLIRLVVQTQSGCQGDGYEPIHETLTVDTDGQTVLYLSDVPVNGVLQFFFDGIKQEIADYTVTGNQVTWNGSVPLLTTDVIEVMYFKYVQNTPGALSDGYVPVVLSVIFPDLSQAAGYPQNMTRLGYGLYAHGLQLPTGADALGTYIAQVYWEEKGQPKNEVFAINVARPFGISNVTPI